MNYFIVIRGPAGVGKSEVAKNLSRYLKGLSISFDRLMKKNKLDTIKGDGIPIEGFIKANNIVIAKAKKSLNNNKTVIFDGCFYRKEQYEHLKKNLPYRHFAFSLKASLKDCQLRNRRRGIKMTEKAIKDVYALVSRTKIGTSIETSKKSVKAVVEEILNHLPTGIVNSKKKVPARGTANNQ